MDAQTACGRDMDAAPLHIEVDDKDKWECAVDEHVDMYMM